MRNLQFKSLPMTEDVPLTSQLITSDPAVPDPEVEARKIHLPAGSAFCHSWKRSRQNLITDPCLKIKPVR